MPLYTCDICNISTTIITHHKRHHQTSKHIRKLEETRLKTQKDPKRPKKDPKRPKKTQKDPADFSNNVELESELDSKSELNPEFKCDYCDAPFSSFAHKRRHELHRCKENTSITNKFIKALELEKKEKNKLYKQIDKLIDKAGNTTNFQTNTQNIKLNGYGKEDFSHITDSFKTQLLNGPYGMIPKMIEQVHFSEDKPENKNISLTNSRDNKMKVFIGDKWVYKNKDEIIHDLMDGKYFILDTHYESMCENLNDINQSRYETFREFFDDREKKMYEQQKKECELVLLNNR